MDGLLCKYEFRGNALNHLRKWQSAGVIADALEELVEMEVEVDTCRAEVESAKWYPLAMATRRLQDASLAMSDYCEHLRRERLGALSPPMTCSDIRETYPI